MFLGGYDEGRFDDVLRRKDERLFVYVIPGGAEDTALHDIYGELIASKASPKSIIVKMISSEQAGRKSVGEFKKVCEIEHCAVIVNSDDDGALRTFGSDANDSAWIKFLSMGELTRARMLVTSDIPTVTAMTRIFESLHAFAASSALA